MAYWRPTDGFASMIRFGQDFIPTRLPELRGMPLTTYPRVGYDGQFYAQLAIRPDVTAADLQLALDNPRYRARRILLPCLAHVLGAGRPWLVVQAYALLNVAAWFLLAWWLHQRTADKGLAGTLCWGAVLLSLGALESVHLALSDLPATVLLVGAVTAMECGRNWLAALTFAAAGLTRETSALAVGMFASPLGARHQGYRTRLLLGALALLPLGAWLLFLACRLPAGDNGVQGNFDWPGAALARHLWLCATKISSGDAHLRHFFGPLAALGLGYQSLYLIWEARTDSSEWIRLALPFAILFWLLGDAVWEGYWAVARVCLPLSVAFYLHIPNDRRLPWRVLLTTLSLPHALYRFWPDFP
ncbi:MAG: hypothetical protein IPL39_05115 [Opitutaceae bacterium]|nr:hypothetical protein [Opitutaceae bacterium]